MVFVWYFLGMALLFCLMCLITYDLYLSLSGKQTISKYLLSLALKICSHPAFIVFMVFLVVFVIGVLFGHLFVPQVIYGV